jgi:hypothetical protein
MITLEDQIALENARQANQTASETQRNANVVAMEAKRIKVDMVKLAKEVLVENARSLPVESRNLTAEQIQAYAASLISYIEG